MNKSIFIGRMATDPKVMSSAGKKTVAYFRIAVERNFKQEGAPNADYFSCVTFGARAELIAKYFYKGKKIALEGEMHNDNAKEGGADPGTLWKCSPTYYSEHAISFVRDSWVWISNGGSDCGKSKEF